MHLKITSNKFKSKNLFRPSFNLEGCNRDYRWIIDSLTFNLLNWNQSGISSFNVDISDQSLSPISVTNFLQHFVANFLHHFLSEQIRIITSSGFPTKYFILNHDSKTIKRWKIIIKKCKFDHVTMPPSQACSHYFWKLM